MADTTIHADFERLRRSMDAMSEIHEATLKSMFDGIHESRDEFRQAYHEFKEGFRQDLRELKEGLRQDLCRKIPARGSAIPVVTWTTPDPIRSEKPAVDSKIEASPGMQFNFSGVTRLAKHDFSRMVDDIVELAFDGCIGNTQMFDPGGIDGVKDCGDLFSFGYHSLEAQRLTCFEESDVLKLNSALWFVSQDVSMSDLLYLCDTQLHYSIVGVFVGRERFNSLSQANRVWKPGRTNLDPENSVTRILCLVLKQVVSNSYRSLKSLRGFHYETLNDQERQQVTMMIASVQRMGSRKYELETVDHLDDMAEPIEMEIYLGNEDDSVGGDFGDIVLESISWPLDSQLTLEWVEPLMGLLNQFMWKNSVSEFPLNLPHSAILRLTKELTWMEEVLAAESSLRTGPASTYADKVFENDMNIAIRLTEKAYKDCMFREALKNGYYDLQAARDEYRLSCGSGGMNHDLILQFMDVQTRLIEPICPQFAEYVWRKVLKKKSCVITAGWPASNELDSVLKSANKYLQDSIVLMRKLLQKQVLGSKKAAKKGAQVTAVAEEKLKGLVFVNEEFDGWRAHCLKILQSKFNEETCRFARDAEILSELKEILQKDGQAENFKQVQKKNVETKKLRML